MATDLSDQVDSNGLQCLPITQVLGLSRPDIDNDGVPNYIDLDGDNDGIPDQSIEAGWS